MESFKDESGKYGYREKHSGKVFIAPQFDAAHSFHEGVAVAMIDHKYGFIDRHGLAVVSSTTIGLTLFITVWPW